jgi:hypothetical protein
MSTNTIAKTNGTNRIDQLADNAVAVQNQLDQIGDAVLLTEQDVKRAEQNVQLLVQQQDRLNRIYAELNKLPSGIKGLYKKSDPEETERRW